MIRAAGGVIVRDGRVLLVHRRRYDDWTLPKGRLEAGETWEEAATREVAEEVGVRGEIVRDLGSTHYELAGRQKEVRWFLMEARDEPSAQSEVDDVRWVALDGAAAELSYESDRALLSRLR